MPSNTVPGSERPRWKRNLLEFFQTASYPFILLRAILQFFDLLSVYHLYCTIKRTFCLSCKRSCKKPNIEPCFCGICLTYFQFFMSFSSALANASSCSLV